MVMDVGALAGGRHEGRPPGHLDPGTVYNNPRLVLYIERASPAIVGDGDDARDGFPGPPK